MTGLDEFYSAYSRVLRKWPADAQAIDVRTVHGTTRVNACGPREGLPLVLLPGSGATSTAWFANVGALSQKYRVYAVDLMGDAGHSVPGGQAVDAVDELLDWVAAVLDGLDLRTAALCGHSYGAMVVVANSIPIGSTFSRSVLRTFRLRRPSFRSARSALLSMVSASRPPWCLQEVARCTTRFGSNRPCEACCRRRGPWFWATLRTTPCRCILPPR